MIEPKIRLSFIVPGAGLLSSQECDENPKENYNENSVFIKYTTGKGKHTKTKTKIINFKTRKSKTATQSVNICEDTYKYMINTPIEAKYNKTTKGGKRVWDTMTIKDKLKLYFDTIANDLHAISYTFEILGD